MSNWYNKNKNVLEGFGTNKFYTYNKQNSIIKYKTLCFNMLNFNTCSYGNKCLYAHSLDEQNIDNSKKMTFELLKLNNLDGVDLIKNKELYNNLLTLTKLCIECANNTCPGGYNCKYGACKKEMLICNIDMQTNNCKNNVENGKCINGMHLTLKNLVPYETQQHLYGEEKEKENKKIKSKRILQTHLDSYYTTTV